MTSHISDKPAKFSTADMIFAAKRLKAIMEISPPPPVRMEMCSASQTALLAQVPHALDTEKFGTFSGIQIKVNDILPLDVVTFWDKDNQLVGYLNLKNGHHLNHEQCKKLRHGFLLPNLMPKMETRR